MTTQLTNHTFRPKCAVCNTITAEIDLNQEKNGWRMKYQGPGGGNGRGDLISAERAQAIIAAFTPPYDGTKIRTADFNDDAGYCLECGAFYCPTHWNITPTGGGWCPNGHFKSLDPHWSPE